MLNVRPVTYLVNRWVLRKQYLTARIPQFDLRFRATPADVIGRHLYKYREYEPEVTRALLQHVRFQPGDVMLDVGANIGWYSLLTERTAGVPVGIFSFEPDPANFELLMENLRLNASTMTMAVPMAVGAKPGIEQLHRYGAGNSGRHSLLPLHKGESLAVPTTTLDAFWAERQLGIRVPRLIKLDIEGYELMALRGARRVLERCQWLLAEYSPGYMRRGGLEPADLVNLLMAADFVPHRINGDKLEPLSAWRLLAIDNHTNILWRRGKP